MRNLMTPIVGLGLVTLLSVGASAKPWHHRPDQGWRNWNTQHQYRYNTIPYNNGYNYNYNYTTPYNNNGYYYNYNTVPYNNGYYYNTPYNNGYYNNGYNNNAAGQIINGLINGALNNRW